MVFSRKQELETWKKSHGIQSYGEAWDIVFGDITFHQEDKLET